MFAYARKHLYIHLILLVVLSFFAGFLTRPQRLEAQAPAPADSEEPSDEDLKQCAEDLTEYMNTALEEMGSLSKVKKLSIAFNMTSPFERTIFQYMEEFDANFDKLDYFSGNTYTLLGARGGTTAMAYYNDGWRDWFSGKPVIFTEFGDFRTAEEPIGNRSGLIGEMKTEYNLANAATAGVLYFAGLESGIMGGGNPEFDFHNLTEAELMQIVDGGPSGAGVNPGVELGGASQLPSWLASHGTPWTLAIITGPNAEGTANWVNSLPEGIKPIIRLCWGSDCGFKDPLVLGQFAKQLDSLVGRETYLIIGPNEPLTDPWVSEACGKVDDRDWEWQPVHCGGPYVDPEFHSLRPYPGNFCLPGTEPVKKVLQCGNKITASEGFDIEWQEDKMGVWGIEGAATGPCLEERVPKVLEYTTLNGDKRTYTTYVRTWTCNGVPIQSTTALTIDMTESELPVLGNTEDVPNGASGTNSLTYAQRVNNYVSWYLQGAVQRAEEDFQSPTDPMGIRNMIDFAGPLQKLYPLGGFSAEKFRYPNKGLRPINIPTGMVAQKLGEGWESVDLGKSHDQIVICKQGGGPEACYIDDSQTRIRRETVRKNPLTVEFSYIPLSTTVDEPGGIFTKRTQVHPGIEDGNEMHYTAHDLDRIEGNTQDPWMYDENLDLGRNWSDILFYPHARESVQLADALQRTFVPQDALRRVALVEAYGIPREVYYRDREDWMDSDSGMPPVKDIDYEDPDFCVVRNAYTNPGDNLYGWLEKEDYDGYDDWFTQSQEAINISTEIVYEGEVSCTFAEDIGDGFADCMGPVREENCVPTGFCTGDVVGSNSCQFGEELCRTYRESDNANNPEACVNRKDPRPCSTTTMASAEIELDVPWVEVIWNRLVNGSMSVYRHLFPRLAANNLSLPPEMQVITPGPEQFENIPGYTTAKYDSDHISHLDTAEGDASGFVTHTGSGALAGDPKEGNPEGELYFPYLGSIHEYFLKGVQCAFLPAGIGCENITYNDSSMCSVENDVIQSQKLLDIIASAANWAHVPTDVLIAVVRGEGCGGGERTGGICQYTDSQVAQYSAPNATDPRNCLPRGRASGPLQIYYDSVNWDPWKNAVVMGTGESRTPNICNIKDAVYAAAYILSAYYDGCANPNHNVASIPTSWSLEDKQRALTGWGQGCSAPLCSGVAGGFYCDKLEEWSGQTSAGECEQSNGASPSPSPAP